MTAFEFGDLVLVPFPFTNQVAIKKRPAVIVSSLAYNQARPDIVIMAVTSQLHPIPAHNEVRISQWQAANLPKPSAIKPVFATIECALVIRYIGRLGVNDQAALKREISDILG
jgi:mRNA interferase MazF